MEDGVITMCLLDAVKDAMEEIKQKQKTGTILLPRSMGKTALVIPMIHMKEILMVRIFGG